MTPSTGLRFPYMFWAHVESHRSEITLSQSGMPGAAPSDLGDPALFADLGHPAEALAVFEAGVERLLGLPAARVLAVPGASGAMHLAALAFFPGAAVVTEIPSYEPFRALPRLFGAELAVVERRPEAGWRLDLERVGAELSRLARPSRPPHLFVSNPQNPTGALMPPEDVRALAALADRHGGVLVSNEVYMEFAPDAARFHAARLAQNAVSLGSLTKAYGLGPLRLGWVALGEGLAGERLGLRDLTYLVHVDPPTPSLRAGIAALERREALLAPLRRFERVSRPRLAAWLEREPRVRGALGPYGLCAFPELAGIADTRAFGDELALEHGVDVVPGEFFGRPGCVRIGFAVEPAVLDEGLGRISRALEARGAGRGDAAPRSRGTE